MVLGHYRNIGFVVIFLVITTSLLSLRRADPAEIQGAITNFASQVVSNKYVDGMLEAAHLRQTPQQCSKALSRQTDLLTQEYSKLLKGTKHVAMIGIPDHPNKGDSAIYVGALILFDMLGITVEHNVQLPEDYNETKMREVMEKFDLAETAIVFHGGGNFGDIWPWYQNLREDVVKAFPEYRIVSVPQSMYYKNPARLETTKSVYKNHTNLHLAARDRASYEAMKEAFGDDHVIDLLPDMATMISSRPSIYQDARQQPHKDFLILARNDGEGGQDHQNPDAYSDLNQFELPSGQVYNTEVKIDDWYLSDPDGLKSLNYADKAYLRVSAAWEFLSQGKVLLTDRLHAHILSTILGVRHVVIEEGNYGKLTHYHEEWLQDCGYYGVITEHGTIADAVEVAKILWSPDEPLVGSKE